MGSRRLPRGTSPTAATCDTRWRMSRSLDNTTWNSPLTAFSHSSRGFPLLMREETRMLTSKTTSTYSGSLLSLLSPVLLYLLLNVSVCELAVLRVSRINSLVERLQSLLYVLDVQFLHYQCIRILVDYQLALCADPKPLPETLRYDYLAFTAHSDDVGLLHALKGIVLLSYLKCLSSRAQEDGLNPA